MRKNHFYFTTNSVKRPAAAVFLGAGDVAGADLEAWIKAAIGSKSLGIRKTAWRTDIGKPGET